MPATFTTTAGATFGPGFCGFRTGYLIYEPQEVVDPARRDRSVDRASGT
jgi:hypothetical protein